MFFWKAASCTEERAQLKEIGLKRAAFLNISRALADILHFIMSLYIDVEPHAESNAS